MYSAHLNLFFFFFLELGENLMFPHNIHKDLIFGLLHYAYV